MNSLRQGLGAYTLRTRSRTCARLPAHSHSAKQRRTGLNFNHVPKPSGLCA